MNRSRIYDLPGYINTSKASKVPSTEPANTTEFLAKYPDATDVPRYCGNYKQEENVLKVTEKYKAGLHNYMRS